MIEYLPAWSWTIVVPKGLQFRRIPRALYHLGIMTIGLWSQFDDSMAVLLKGIERRVLGHQLHGKLVKIPNPRWSQVRKALWPAWRLLQGEQVKAQRMDLESFFSRYPLRKRLLYHKAASELGRRALCKEDFDVRAFIKREKTLQALDKDPRIIHPRKYTGLLAWGRIYFTMEKGIYAIINKWFNDFVPSVMKGMNVSEMAKVMHKKWEMFSDPCAVIMDASRFDAHHKGASISWEYRAYEYLCRDSIVLEDIKEMVPWLTNYTVKARCREGTVVYKCNSRASGDPHTSGGNTFMVACALVASRENTLIEIAPCINGDDLVVISERRDSQRFVQDFIRRTGMLGWRYRVLSTVDVFEEIEFGHCHPVCVGGEWRMCRGLSALEKDLFIRRPVNNSVEYERWMATIGHLNLALNAGVPVLQAAAIEFLRRSKGRKPFDNDEEVRASALYQLSKRMEARQENIEAVTRRSFFMAFGVQPALQRAWEHYFEGHCLKEPHLCFSEMM